MPFDAFKIAHVKNKLATIMSGRTQSVILTLNLQGGGTTTLTVNAIWRVQEDQDPDFDPAGHKLGDVQNSDVLAMFNMADVSYDQIRSVAYAQLADGQPGPDIATRWIPTFILVRGMVPGGDRIFVGFDRQR